jgi:DNA-binding transcriptional ArsR family regulator
MRTLSADELLEMAEMFHMLGEPNRLGIVLSCLEEAVTVGSMAERLGLSPSLVSHHLRLLRAARLLKGEREGKHIRYRVADQHIREVLGNMVEHLAEEDDPTDGSLN